MKYTLSDNILRFIVPDYLSLSSRQQILIQRLFDAVEASDKSLAAMFHERLSEIDDKLDRLLFEDEERLLRESVVIMRTLSRNVDRLHKMVPIFRAFGRACAAHGIASSDYEKIALVLFLIFRECLGDEFSAEMDAALTALYDKSSREMKDAAYATYPLPLLR
jgi:hemoglobin-like flavoprotein